VTSWDPTKHPHGVHGHWATVGGTKGGRKKVDRSVLEGRGVVGRGPNAFKPAAPAASRRTAKNSVTGSVRDVRTAYAKHESGQKLSFHERESISYQAPKLRDAQTARTGSPIMPRAEAIRRDAAIGQRDQRPRRTRVKQTFTGKKVADRSGLGLRENGNGVFARDQRVHGLASKRSARTVMSGAPAKPAASAHPQYTRRQLSLKTDAWMRDQLNARGTPVPKGARTKVLTGLLASD
jgi:hypothetical protein